MPGAPREALLASLQRLAQAKRPVPLITLVYVDGSVAMTAAEIKRISPATTVIARILRGPDYRAADKGGWDRTTRADGRAYFDLHADTITDDMRLADFIQFFNINEPGEGANTNLWWQGLLDGADAAGVKLAVYNFSYGNPGLPGDELPDGSPRPYRDFWTWNSTVALLRRVKSGKHALCLHQYADHDDWTNNSTILRHRRIWPLLPPDLRDLKLWINECGESYIAEGTPPDRSGERYQARLRSLQRSLHNDFGDPDVALWTFGNGGDEQWNRDRLEHILPVIERISLEEIV